VIISLASTKDRINYELLLTVSSLLRQDYLEELNCEIRIYLPFGTEEYVAKLPTEHILYNQRIKVLWIDFNFFLLFSSFRYSSLFTQA
jgi:hypothetical protein